MNKTQINTPNAPAPGGAYSQGIVANGFLFTAGVGPQDPQTGQVAGDDIRTQTRQVMTNLQGILAGQGLTFDDVVKTTVHLQDLGRDFAGFNETYATFITRPAPVRTTVGSNLAHILVEIDLVAVATGPDNQTS